MKRFLLYALLFVFLISCGDEPKNTEKDEKQLSFSTQNLQKSLKDCDPEEGDCTFISLSFPYAEGDSEASENINGEIVHFLNRTLDFQEESISRQPEELTTEFIDNYRETAEDFQEYEMAWEARISGQVIYMNDQIISMSFNTDMFTGGAHGYQSIHYLNFDPENGQRLKAQDIFKPEFIGLVEKDFRKMQNIPGEANINSTGLFFENDQFHLPENIGFKDGKVILHYNAYEIAPYSAGDFLMSYPLSEISKYLKLEIAKSNSDLTTQ